MNNKKTIGIICGGTGLEHEVDLFSTRDIDTAFDRSKYNVVILGIDKDGYWHFSREDDYVHSDDKIETVGLNLSKPIVYPGPRGKLIAAESGAEIAKVDIYFPITDDPVQGHLHMLDVPFIGSENIGAVLCRDKDISKRLLAQAGLPILPYRTLVYPETISYEEAQSLFGPNLFIKACTLGSSIGIYKATCRDEFDQALTNAFRHDKKVLIEKTIQAREIECAVLGNRCPEAATAVAELTGITDFFDFETKYFPNFASSLKIPASLDEDVVHHIRQAAVSAYKTLNCEGAARVDFFLTDDNKFIINEVNASPGLGKNLAYPRMWEGAGVAYHDLLDRLIQLAIERHKHKQSMLTDIKKNSILINPTMRTCKDLRFRQHH